MNRIYCTCFVVILSMLCIQRFSCETEQLTNLLSRIEVLEHKGQEQVERTEMYRRLFDEQKSINLKQSERLDKQEERLHQLLKKVEYQDTVISHLLNEVRDELPNNEGDTPTDMNENHERESTFTTLSETKKRDNDGNDENVKLKRSEIDQSPVAFHARLDGILQHLGLNENVRFDVLLTNMGGGYHMSHGLFIAPVHGIYILSTSVFASTSTHPWIEVFLEKNGNLLAGAHGYSNGITDQGSTTVVTELDVGDEVWVSVHRPTTDGYIAGYGFANFMGCLITRLYVE